MYIKKTEQTDHERTKELWTMALLLPIFLLVASLVFPRVHVLLWVHGLWH